jgi:hypothetical protein
MASWGHEIYQLPENEAIDFDARGYRCGTGGRICGGIAAFFTTYRYITGRAGRVSDARKLACANHARRFAIKHDIDWETVQTAPFYGSGAAGRNAAIFNELAEALKK